MAFVEEGTLVSHISVLRKALGTGPDSAQYIETIPKRRYRLLRLWASQERPPHEVLNKSPRKILAFAKDFHPPTSLPCLFATAESRTRTKQMAIKKILPVALYLILESALPLPSFGAQADPPGASGQKVL
jgi:hypothetical protein